MASKLQEIMTHTTIGAVAGKEGSNFLVGVSPSMMALEAVLAEIAPTNIPILLEGEIGTGKETFAQQIHLRSDRHLESLGKISCASMKVETFGAELGLRANGNGETHRSEFGTLLFDEISELSPELEMCLRGVLRK